LKPSNIIIHKYTLEPWILDFGIARDLNLKSQSKITDVGTPLFRPPECLDKIGPFTDIYALGTTLLALTGLLNDTDMEWISVLNRCPFTNDLKEVISSMIASDHTKRFQTCQDALQALQNLLDETVPQPLSRAPDRLDLSEVDPCGQRPRPNSEPSIDWKAPPAQLDPSVGRRNMGVVELFKNHLVLNVGVPVFSMIQLADGTLAYTSGKLVLKVDSHSLTILRGLIFQGHTDTVFVVTQLPDSHLASASKDNTIRIWDLDSGTCLRIIPTPPDPAGSLFSAFKLVVSWDVEMYTLFGLDSDTLVSGRTVPENGIKIWNLKTGRLIKALDQHQPSTTIMRLKDGTLASGAAKSIKIWDPTTWNCVKTLSGDAGVVFLLQLFDGSLASGTWSGNINIWDLKTGLCTKTLKPDRSSGIVCAMIQRDDGTLVSCLGNGSIKIWNIEKELCTHTVKAHAGLVASMIQMADGRFASCSLDGTIKVWGGTLADNRRHSSHGTES